jgi:hypothetical protein
VDAGCPEAFSSQGNIFHVSVLFHVVEPALGGVWTTPEMPSRHLSYYPDANCLAFFNGVNLFNFIRTLLTKLQVFQVFLLYFLFLILIINLTECYAFLKFPPS